MFDICLIAQRSRGAKPMTDEPGTGTATIAIDDGQMGHLPDDPYNHAYVRYEMRSFGIWASPIVSRRDFLHKAGSGGFSAR
jgi:hypothetical protein